VTLKTQLAILGAGPASSAAAITAAASGLDVVVLDRAAEIDDKPGETLHPGIEPLLARLGVLDRVMQEGFLRHDGYFVESASARTYSAYGADTRGPWRGFQALRRRFDSILLDAAAGRGASVVRPVRAREPILRDGRVCGLELDSASISARFVIDAAGGAHWLARHLRRPVRRVSQNLIARYGYAGEPVLGDGSSPVFRWEAAGWLWSAPVAERRHAWVRLNVRGQNSASPVCASTRVRGANVTWRIVPECAGPGYFVAGDAAAVIDPAASHGVLKAIMSGMFAAHLIAGVLRGRVLEPHATEEYRSWMSRLFWSDVTRLRDFYGPMLQVAGKSADHSF
jgi:flavin-dependent dehydrogenase